MKKVEFKKITWVTILAFSIGSVITAQKSLTLKECYEAATTSSSLAAEKEIYPEISALKERNINSVWFPALDLNGSALYNSDVVDLSSAFASLPIPGMSNIIGPMPHDQYKITLDINQVLYDGGNTRLVKNLEKAELRINEKQTEADLYKLKSQINGYFFNILLLNRQKDLLENYLGLLENRLKAVQSAVDNGVLLRSDADILRSELINLKQQLSENEIRTNALLAALSSLTGIEITEETELMLPQAVSMGKSEYSRPELELINMRKEQLDAVGSLATAKRMPKAFGLATLGYGNPPGSNFFMDEFDTYYIIGAGVKWNIFDWNRVKNEKQIISLQKNLLEGRKKDLTDNLSRQLDLKSSEIKNLEEMINSDRDLVEIRQKITATAASQHDNGIITATEYLNILNSEKQAMINSEIHLINLAMARIEYLNISGQQIE